MWPTVRATRAVVWMPRLAASLTIRAPILGAEVISSERKPPALSAMNRALAANTAARMISAVIMAAARGRRGIRCSRIRTRPSISTIRNSASTSGVRIGFSHSRAAPDPITARMMMPIRAAGAESKVRLEVGCAMGGDPALRGASRPARGANFDQSAPAEARAGWR